MEDDRNDLPTRSPAVGPPAEQTVSNTDERNFNTLLEAQALLEQEIWNLYKDFNAFDVYKDDHDDKAKQKLLRDIDGKQVAYDILMSVKAKLDDTIQKIEQKNEERQ